MSINWFPGHMVKARRVIQENIKLVDIIIIVLDARAPFACRNLLLEKMASHKTVLFILNKSDLVTAQDLKRLTALFQDQGHQVIAVDSHTGKGFAAVFHTIKSLFAPQLEQMIRKGRRERRVRIMVAGAPNVGKSTFLNKMVGRKTTRTGAKPGVTRDKQWVRIKENYELLDTPGLMWPNIETREQGIKLALLNIIGEKAYNQNDVVLFFLEFLREKTPDILQQKFALEPGTLKEPEEMLAHIARRRGNLLKGGKLDTDKTCTALLQEFRSGALGKICLD